MNKRNLALMTLAVVFSVSISAATTIKVGNFTEKTSISDFRIKVKFEDNTGKAAKGYVHVSVTQGSILDVDLSKAINKKSGCAVADQVDMENLKTVKVVKALPKGFYSRAKNSKKQVSVIVIKNNSKEKFKTLKDGSKVQRLLKVKFC